MGRPKKEMSGRCRFCGVALDGTNWLPSAQRQRRLICTSCNRVMQAERQKKWIAENPEKAKAKQQRYWRRQVQVGQVRVVADRPLKAGQCANCGAEGQTAAHHFRYDPEHPTEYTIELCNRCHGALHRAMQLRHEQVPGRDLVDDWFKGELRYEKTVNPKRISGD